MIYRRKPLQLMPAPTASPSAASSTPPLSSPSTIFRTGRFRDQNSCEGNKESEILAAEVKKQSAILAAEANQQSTLLVAEANRQAVILEAEDEAKAILQKFQATAEGLERLSEAMKKHGVTELAGNVTRDNKKNMIILRHIQLAMKNDEELGRLLAGIMISNGGVLPNIHRCYSPRSRGRGRLERSDLHFRSFRDYKAFDF